VALAALTLSIVGIGQSAHAEMSTAAQLQGILKVVHQSAVKFADLRQQVEPDFPNPGPPNICTEPGPNPNACPGMPSVELLAGAIMTQAVFIKETGTDYPPNPITEGNANKLEGILRSLLAADSRLGYIAGNPELPNPGPPQNPELPDPGPPNVEALIAGIVAVSQSIQTSAEMIM